VLKFKAHVADATPRGRLTATAAFEKQRAAVRRFFLAAAPLLPAVPGGIGVSAKGKRGTAVRSKINGLPSCLPAVNGFIGTIRR